MKSLLYSRRDIRRRRALLPAIAGASALALAAGFGALAQDQETAAPTTPVEGQIVEQPERTALATDLIGAEVADRQGEPVGKVADLVIGDDNAVSGVVVGVGGLMGLGASQHAFEIDAIRIEEPAEGVKQVMLNVTREEIESAPEFLTLEERRRVEATEEARREAESLQQQQQQQPLPNE